MSAIKLSGSHQPRAKWSYKRCKVHNFIQCSNKVSTSTSSGHNLTVCVAIRRLRTCFHICIYRFYISFNKITPLIFLCLRHVCCLYVRLHNTVVLSSDFVGVCTYNRVFWRLENKMWRPGQHYSTVLHYNAVLLSHIWPLSKNWTFLWFGCCTILQFIVEP